MKLPNVRKLFLPDPDKIIFDADLAGADAQVVAWDARDEALKSIFRAGKKLHAENAKTIFGTEKAGHDGRTEPYYSLAKKGVHATNYGAKSRTLSASLGISIAEADRFQEAWFEAHPAIPEWHRRVERDILTTRSVRNAFGYRRYYFDRPDSILTEALAWIPQSTVACVINRALLRLDKELPELELLLQVHDSLVGQYPKTYGLEMLSVIKKTMQIVVPYPDPLVIPVNVKISDKSWGEVKEP